jgi:hypothetical protein
MRPRLACPAFAMTSNFKIISSKYLHNYSYGTGLKGRNINGQDLQDERLPLYRTITMNKI